MILQLWSAAEGPGESFKSVLPHWLIGLRGIQQGSQAHTAVFLSPLTEIPARLTKCPSPCYDLWKVPRRHYIFHKGILLHSCGLWGAVRCGLVPRHRRIKCRTLFPQVILTWILIPIKCYFFSQHKPDPKQEHSTLYFFCSHTLLNIISDKRCNPLGRSDVY